MRARLLAALLLGLLGSVSLPAESIRVAAWNLEWFPGRKPESTPEEEKEHIAAVRAVLRELAPDVLVLEEIKKPESIRDIIQDIPGMRVVAVSEFTERAQQIALCIRLPVNDSGWTEWPHAAMAPPRGFTYADVQVATDAVLHVEGHHWKSNRGALPVNATLRTISAVYTDELASRRLSNSTQRVACLIAGDLNTSMDESEFGQDPAVRYMIGRGWYWPFGHLPAESRRTWRGHGSSPQVQFDHLLLKNLGHPRAEVGKHGGASDHSPILITVKTEDIARPSPSR